MTPLPTEGCAGPPGGREAPARGGGRALPGTMSRAVWFSTGLQVTPECGAARRYRRAVAFTDNAVPDLIRDLHASNQQAPDHVRATPESHQPCASDTHGFRMVSAYPERRGNQS